MHCDFPLDNFRIKTLKLTEAALLPHFLNIKIADRPEIHKINNSHYKMGHNIVEFIMHDNLSLKLQ